ncbi:MAG: protein-disulfide reductase DsbD N-terminal domain-containing protein, partial [Bdellovibrionales bacterium]|nr:protein-disulfide reductase DsbD N-terminal domain-containing protein [Bdellovibrionales bacterium]
MKIISTLLISLLMATEIAPLATDVNPLQVVGHKLDKSSVGPGKEVTVVLDLRLLAGFHAYSDKFKVFSLLPDGARIKDVVVSPVVQFVDFSGKNHQGIEGDSSVTFKVDLPQDSSTIDKLQYEISYIACTPKFCLPQKEVMTMIPISDGKPSLGARLREKMSGAIHLESDLEAQLSANLAV